MAEQDARGRVAYAVKKAEEKAEEKGLLKGKVEVINRCLEENMAIDLIAKIVDLSVEELQKIIDQIKKAKEK